MSIRSMFTKPPKELPEVPERLSRRQLQAILDGPNGRALIAEFRKGELERSQDFGRKIQEAERYVDLLRGMKANADGMASDMGELLGEVRA